MSTSQQTYKQAMYNLSVANMLHTENKIVRLMCIPRGYKGILSAQDLYDLHYESIVGEIKYDDEVEPLEDLKRAVAYALLKLFIRDLDVPYEAINYNNLVREIERAFWNSENWNKPPIELAQKYVHDGGIYTITDFHAYFKENKEKKAFSYIINTYKCI